jgi:hypothetical protein
MTDLCWAFLWTVDPFFYRKATSINLSSRVCATPILNPYVRTVGFGSYRSETTYDYVSVVGAAERMQHLFTRRHWVLFQIYIHVDLYTRQSVKCLLRG